MISIHLFSIHLIYVKPTHLPDILTHLPGMLTHLPDTARHPQPPSRDPSDTPNFGLYEATGRKSNFWIPWYLFNLFQFILYLKNPRHLPDMFRHHPDTARHPLDTHILGLRAPTGRKSNISKYYDINSTVLNLYDIYPPQPSARHVQTPSRHCQTPSATIQTPFRRPYLTVIWPYVISILLCLLVHLGRKLSD